MSTKCFRSIMGLVLLTLIAGYAQAKPRLSGIKIAITNPTDIRRPAEKIVIQIADLKKIAPELKGGCLIVTATDATTVEEDLSKPEAEELPSQVDDITGNKKAEELAFEIDLKPHQTRIVTVTYGDVDSIYHLRQDYPMRTNALFATKYEGMGWESERAAYRIYFDKRNAIDLYAKKRMTLQLQRYATPEFPYHDESPDGRDTYKIGDALSIGSCVCKFNDSKAW